MKSSELSLIELFAMESESQCRTLAEELVVVETGGATPERLEILMRAAHSLKGAARIVNYNQAVQIAHAMEDTFVAAQQEKRTLSRGEIDNLLFATDLLKQIGASRLDDDTIFIDEVAACLALLRQTPETAASSPEPVDANVEKTDEKNSVVSDKKGRDAGPRMLRVNAENLDRLLGSAAESLVASRRMRGFTDRLWNAHRHQRRTAKTLETLMTACDVGSSETFRRLQSLLAAGDHLLLNEITEADRLERNGTQLAQRLYSLVLNCRMRPFAEISGGLRRAARDAAQHLGRAVDVEIIGEGTEVDRDLLEKLESPLAHLIRNAVEHGIESPALRRKAGKPATGKLRIEASHIAGFLVIRIADDGRGVKIDTLRKKIAERELADAATIGQMELSELLEFLFLPGFSLKESVSEMSGRGVGLDVVRSLAAESRGTVQISTEEHKGTRFSLRFPVSLSVMRVIIFELAGEAYALPLARVESAVHCPNDAIESVEGRQFFLHDGKRVGLVDGAEVIGKPAGSAERNEIYALILSDETKRFGVTVGRFLGEANVVIQPLDAQLKQVHNIAAAALTEDGEPLLLLDVDDFLLSIKRINRKDGRKTVVARSEAQTANLQRILVVEDSLTVRELERKLITALGYAVDVAVDGADGWHAIRSGGYAAVITDIDMPRMDGIELTRLIKNDPRLREVPVIIVSYKDREEDRRRGLDAGADYYLTKGSFQDEGLARALRDVLGGTELS